MGKITIFRFTNTGDTFATVTDKIEFNTSNKTNTKNAFITEVKFNPTDGVGNNQGAEQDLGDQQALGLVEDIIKITGFISQRNSDSGENTFLVKMKAWKNDAKINDNWDLGRFGYADSDDKTDDITPTRTGTSQVGLLWEKIEWTTDFKGNRKMFTLYFRINRGDGT